MKINNKFNLGQLVYLKTDREQSVRIVTSIIVSLGALTYQLSCSDSYSTHYEYEISSEKDLFLTLSN